MARRMNTLPKPPALATIGAIDHSAPSTNQQSDPPVVVDSPLPGGFLPGTLKELVSPLIRTIALHVPVANAAVPGYLKRHIELQLKPDEATTLAQISAALDSNGARLADGKHVGASKPLAFRYLLQQIGKLFATPREQL